MGASVTGLYYITETPPLSRAPRPAPRRPAPKQISL